MKYYRCLKPTNFFNFVSFASKLLYDAILELLELGKSERCITNFTRKRAPFPAVGTYTFKRGNRVFRGKGPCCAPQYDTLASIYFVFAERGYFRHRSGGGPPAGAASLLALKRLIKFAFETLTV